MPNEKHLQYKFDISRYLEILDSIKEAIKILWRINPKILILALVVNIVWGSLAVPTFYLQKLILDEIIANIGHPSLQIALSPLILLLAARAFIEFLRIILGSTSEYLRFISSRLFQVETELMISRKISELDIATLENPEFQDRFSKIQREIGGRSWNFIYPIVSLPNFIAGFLSSLGLLIFLSPFVVIATIAVSIPQFFFDAQFIKKEYKLETRLSPLYRTWGWLVHYLMRSRNFLELRVLNIAPYFLKKLYALVDSVYKPRLELEKQRTITYFFVSIPNGILIFGVGVYLAILAITQKITIGSVQMYTNAVLSTQNNVGGLVSSFLQIYASYLYMEDLIWFLKLKPKLNVHKGKIIESPLKKGIVFDHVWFAYKDEKWILKDMSFEIKPNEKVAIVGINGAGKSTLNKLIARFYDPQKGNVFVGGKNLKDVNVFLYREKIALLIQRFETYPFSAKESIGYGDLSRMDNIDEIQYAAKQTDIDPWISRLPLSYDTPLSPEFEKGVEPSIGQWQRIAISRILFRKNADIIILDEPTSNVDPEAEESIFRRIAEITKDKLLIFVSQKFSTVRWADRIIVVDNGKIAEQGTHDELMKLNGEYAKLFLLQAQGYK